MQGLPFLKRLLLQGVLFLRKKYDENTGGCGCSRDYLKGPAKRTAEDDRRFDESTEK